MNNRTAMSRALLLAGAAFAFAQPALAQTEAQPAEGSEAQQEESSSQPTDSGEIVVTARRRAESLQDVPIAITAYSGAQLERSGAVDITEVGETTPNVTLETSRGTNTTLTAFIRGVGQQDPVAGFEQGVGIYLDDVYLNRPQGAVLDIYDVERIEVLRGPQGTLYGRNTIGGAIKYVTRRLSDDTQLGVRAKIGSYRQRDLIVSASSPLGGGVKIGGSVARLTRDGFGKNLTTGSENYNKDIWAARGTIEAEPGGDAFLRLSGDYSWDTSNPRGGHRLIPGRISGAPVLDDVFDTRGGLVDPEQKVKGGGVALHAETSVAEGVKLRSITAYRKDSSKTPIDFDTLPAVDVDVPAIYRNRQFSQEVQAVIERGPLAGVVGAYYLNARARNIFDVRLYTTGAVLSLPGLTAVTQGDVGTKTWAIFGDFTYEISPQLSLSAGLRYTDDRREALVYRDSRVRGGQPGLGGSGGFDIGTPFAVTSNFTGKRKDSAWTPRLSVSYQPTDDHNLYASYSRGFKGGGFDPRGQSTAAPDINGNGVRDAEDIYEFMDFEPETVDSYELGWKGALFDRRLRLATAVFQADYKDVQVPGSVGGTIPGTSIPTFVGVTTNAGKARFRGVEVEAYLAAGEDLATPGDRLNLSGTLGYLDAKYLEFVTVVNRNPDGTPFPTGTPPREVDLADFRKVQNTPKWTLSGTLEYDTPAFGGRLNANTSLSYRSKSQQFEIRTPGLDQKGFALLDANLVWRAPDDRMTIGIHGKNLTNKKYITAGYNFFLQNPYTGDFITTAGAPATTPALMSPTLGREGVLTAFYGNPRQLILSLGYKF